LNGADQLAASMRTYKEPAILISTHTLSCSWDPGSSGKRYRHEVEQLWPVILLKTCRYSLHFPNIHITSNNTNRAAGNSNNKVMNRRSSSAADRTVGPRRSRDGWWGSRLSLVSRNRPSRERCQEHVIPLVLGRRISIRGVWQPRGTARHRTRSSRRKRCRQNEATERVAWGLTACGAEDRPQRTKRMRFPCAQASGVERCHVPVGGRCRVAVRLVVVDTGGF
jgi:hypothetical protein